MSSNDLSLVILAVVGTVLQLVFRYFPPVQAWYSEQENKGLIMLAAVIVTSGAYFGLSCTPFAAQLGIQAVCNTDGAFEMLKALAIIATSNQLAYLFTKPNAPEIAERYLK